ncbi:MAG: hypothetical protein DRH04_03655 [Deltaproteobacteria bacterium]|nr:MAG: hypothetical protein DRH04_03655 [Deltaproteobacteria bacterium]
MKKICQAKQLKRARILSLLFFICLVFIPSSNAAETAKSLPGMQQPYEYSSYDAVISGIASTTEGSNILTVSGSCKNNYWEPFCNIDVYLKAVMKDGRKIKAKRFYLGDLLEDESGKFELAVTRAPGIDHLELVFIYEICSIREDTSADSITIIIPWPAP